MAGTPIKFRCYQCNQLLGVARSKGGRTVNCPRCGTGLLVPEADESPAAATAAQQGVPGLAPGYLADVAAGLPEEIAEIRPEDIRVESGDSWEPIPIDVDTSPRAAATAPPPQPPPPEQAEPPPFLAGFSGAAAEQRGPDSGFASAATPLVEPPFPAAGSQTTLLNVPPPMPPPPAAGANAAPLEPGVPPIRVEPPSLRTERTPTGRARDLILPRSVVAFWSLFVLLAQALAFVAGLLAGHFVWRVH